MLTLFQAHSYFPGLLHGRGPLCLLWCEATQARTCPRSQVIPLITAQEKEFWFPVTTLRWFQFELFNSIFHQHYILDLQVLSWDGLWPGHSIHCGLCWTERREGCVVSFNIRASDSEDCSDKNDKSKFWRKKGAKNFHTNRLDFFLWSFREHVG